MRALLTAVAALIGLMATRQVNAGQISLIKTYPRQGGWTTLLARLPDGTLVCTSTSENSTVNFTFSNTASHLYVQYPGPILATTKSITVSVDGIPVVDLPVLMNEVEVVHGIKFGHLMADMPGTSARDDIFPALAKGRRMQVDIGDRRFTAELDRFAAVVAQVAECASDTEAYVRQGAIETTATVTGTDVMACPTIQAWEQVMERLHSKGGGVAAAIGTTDAAGCVSVPDGTHVTVINQIGSLTHVKGPSATASTFYFRTQDLK